MKDKIIGNIFRAEDISKFHANALNREVNQKHVMEIVESINDTGVVVMPIIVDTNFNVLDGHHRLAAREKRYVKNKHHKIIHMILAILTMVFYI